MRVLVIGGTNFIGPEVVRRLQAAGADVTVLHRGEREDDLGDARHIHADRSTQVEEARRLQPDVILDMAPIHAGHGADDAAAGEAAGAQRVVAISSVDTYRGFDVVHGRDGAVQPTPFREGDEVRRNRRPMAEHFGADHPMARYEKLDVEDAVLAGPSNGVVLRLPVVYGPKDFQRRLHPLLRRIDDGADHILLPRSLAGWRFGKAFRSDVADAIVAGCLHPAATGIYNVGSFGGTEAEWAGIVGRALGWGGEVVVLDDDLVPESMREDANLAQDLVADSTRLRTELGWTETTDRDDGIRLAAEWERANPDPDFTWDRQAEEEAVRRGSTRRTH